MVLSTAVPLPKYVEEFDVPTPESAPLAITVDSSGRVWFTESNASKLGMFDPVSGTFKEFKVPSVGDMWGIVADQDGHLWMTQYAGRGSVNPGGTIVQGGTGRLVSFDEASRNFTSITVPGNGSFPMRITVDEENRVWFTEFLGGKIGEYDQYSKRLREYSLPNNFSGPADLSFDKNGLLWFTEAYSQRVGTFDVGRHSFSEYNLSVETPPGVVGSPVGLAVDHEGKVWVADHGGSWIVRFDPVTGMTTHYPTRMPPADVYPLSIPNGLLIDSEDKIWFSEHGGNSIGSLSADREMMVEYTIPSGPLSTSLWIALAPNGDVWFAEWAYNKIGVVHTKLPVPVSVHATKGSLTVEAGDTLSLSISANSNVLLEGNGTWDYSWSSYNPKEISVVFYQQYPSLETSDQVQTGAEAQLSTRVYPGNYTLAIGLNLGQIRVSTMLAFDVQGNNKSNSWPFVPIALVAIALTALVIIFRRRLFRSRNRL
jgi:virginiamycin B lyase